MKNIVRAALLLTVLSLADVSCLLEKEVAKDDGNGIPVALKINTRAPGDGSAEDQYFQGRDWRVTELRVLIYEKGVLKYNFSSNDTDPAKRLNVGNLDGTNGDASQENTIHILSGTYDFVFIGNEKLADNTTGTTPNLYTMLQDEANYNTLTKLKALYTGKNLNNGFADAGLDTESIIMSSHYRDVVITSNVKGDVTGVSYTDPFDGTAKTVAAGVSWSVQLERLAIRLRIDLALDAEQQPKFEAGAKANAITVALHSTGTWLLPRDDNSDYIDRSDVYTLSVPEVTEEKVNETPTGRKIYTYDFIMPEHVLNAEHNADPANYAMKLTATALGKSVYLTTGEKRPEDATKIDYSIPRNTFLHVAATVERDKIVLDKVVVVPWNDVNKNSNIATYSLKVGKDLIKFKSWESAKDGGYKLEELLNVEADHPDGWKIENIVYEPVYDVDNQAKKVDATTRGYAEGWLTPVKQNNGTASIKVATNHAPASFRAATFDVVAGNMRKTIRVEQAAGGYLAAPGVIGVGVESGKLTINGSREYKGSKVSRGGGESNYSLLIEEEPMEIENETVYVVYFKWGSMIATTSAGGHKSSFTLDDIVWAPQEYKGAGSEAAALARVRADVAERAGSGASSGSLWEAIPYYGINTNWDPTPNDPYSGFDIGLGDPCRYFVDFYGSLPGGGGSNGGWNGGTFGNADNQPIAPYLVDWGGVGTDLPAGVLPTSGDWAMFLPLTGFRHGGVSDLKKRGRVYHYNSNDEYGVKDAGYYWSSSRMMSWDGYVWQPTSAARGSLLSFTLSPTSTLSSLYAQENITGFPIRCISNAGL